MTTYTITLTNGTVLTTIAPQTLDTSHTSLTLWGQGEPTYGQLLHNDMVHMLENFSNPNAPAHPLTGQLWYDSAFSIFRVWNGTSWVALRPDALPSNAGIATTVIGTSPSIVGVLSNGKVIATISDRFVANASLPTTISFRDTNYVFASRFPSGIGAGVTISSDVELSPSDNSDTLVTSKWVRQQGFNSTLSSSQITAALGYTPLNPASNLSELTEAATARTNLGLGSMATQSASSVALTGGTINGISIGGTTPSSGVFTTISLTGSQTAKYVLAAPTNSAGPPTWRQLAASDILDAETTANKGVANGYASLDSTGHVPLAQIPSVVGGIHYKGTWDASTNVPALASGVGTQGDLYVVSTAGTTTLDGISSWSVGDYVLFDGTAWQRVPNPEAVSSVAGRTGAVVLSISDISGGAPLASPVFTGSPTAPTVATNDNSTNLATTAYVKAQNYLTTNQPVTLSGVVSGSGSTAITTSFAPIASNAILANVSNTSGAPSATALTSILDTISNAQGALLYRGATSWNELAPGVVGQVLQTQGVGANPAWTNTVVSFNSRGGVVTLSSSDVTTALGYTPANLASPAFTGVPTAPTATSSDNSTTLATTAYVKSQNYITGNQNITLSGAVSGSGSTAITTTLASIPTGNVLANISGTGAAPVATTTSALFDNAFGVTQGDLIYRSATGWIGLAAGTSGAVLQTQGTGANPQWTTTSTLLDAFGSAQGSILYRGASGWSALSSGNSGQILQTQGTGANPQWTNGNLIAGSLRLRGSAAGGAKTASWTADEIVAQTTLNGLSYKGTSLSLSFDGATIGAGGMDTGSTPTSGNLAIYAIYNPTTTTWNTLGYASGASAASTIYGGANMPSGYTASYLLWVGVTDGSGNLQKFSQNQKTVTVNSVQVLSAIAGVADTYSTLSLVSIVPPNAYEIFGTLGGTLATQPIEIAIASDTSGSFVSYLHNANPGGGIMDGLAGASSFGTVPLTTPQQIAWKSFNTNQTNVIKIRGYTF